MGNRKLTGNEVMSFMLFLLGVMIAPTVVCMVLEAVA